LRADADAAEDAAGADLGRVELRAEDGGRAILMIGRTTKICALCRCSIIFLPVS